MRGSSSRSRGKGKGRSFPSRLKNVTEDKEAGADEDAGDLGGSRSVKAAPRRRRKTLSARRRRSSSLRSAASDDKSFRLFHSDTTASSSSRRLLVKESVNMMDFGVDPDVRPFTESMLSLRASSANTASTRGSLSSLVDSQGFLGWDNDTSSDSASISSSHAGRRPASKRCPPKGLDSWTLRDSSVSNLADSVGYLGWDSQRRMGNSAKDLDTRVIGGAGNFEGDGGKKKDAAAEEEDKSLDAHEKSWLVADDEGLNGNAIDPSKGDGSENALSKHFKRLSSKVTKGILTKRSTWNGADAPKEVQAEMKHILFAGRTDSMPMLSEDKTKEDNGVLSSLFGSSWNASDAMTLFGNASWNTSDASQSLNIEDEYYSRGNIRINREDDIDIWELRRELLEAAAERTEDNNSSKSRLKMGFF